MGVEGPTVPITSGSADEVFPPSAIQPQPFQAAAVLDDLKRTEGVRFSRFTTIIHPLASVATGSVPRTASSATTTQVLPAPIVRPVIPPFLVDTVRAISLAEPEKRRVTGFTVPTR